MMVSKCLHMMVERLENRYDMLASRHRHYSSRNIPCGNQLMEEMYLLRVRFNPEHEL